MNVPRAKGSGRGVIIGGLLTLALAGLFTLMAPLHIVRLQRAPDGRVSGSALRFILVVIPVRSTNLAGLDEVKLEVDSSSRSGRRKTRIVFWASEHFQAEIPVSPSSAEDVRDRVTGLLQGTGGAALWEIMVPTWAFGVVIPAVIAALGMRLTYMTLTGRRQGVHREGASGIE